MQANGRTRRLFGRLKLFPGWQHRGESAVYDCLVRVRDGVRGWRSVRVGLLSTKLAFLGKVYSQVRVRVTLVSGARELSSMMIFQRQMSGRGKVFGGGGKCPTFVRPPTSSHGREVDVLSGRQQFTMASFPTHQSHSISRKLVSVDRSSFLHAGGSDLWGWRVSPECDTIR